MDYKKIAYEKQNAIVKDLQDWVGCGSVYDESTITEEHPFGLGVSNALEWVANKAEKDGFTVERCDGYCTEITYGNKEGLVLVLGHADVVPVGTGWNHAPFGGEVVGDLMFGRGTSDDKGPTLAAYYALKIIKELKIPTKRKIRIVVGGNEERGSLCLHHYFEEMHKPHPDFGFTPDADFPLIYGEKGIMTYDYFGEIEDNVIISLEGGVATNSVPASASAVLKGIYDFEKEFEEFNAKYGVHGIYEIKDGNTYLTFFGKASHGAFPEGGVNALAFMIKFIGRYTESRLCSHFGRKLDCYYGRHLGVDFDGPAMGKLTMNLGLGKYMEGKYHLLLNFRYPIDMDYDNLIAKLEENILDDGKIIVDSKPLYVNPESKFIQILLKVYQDVSGDLASKPMTIGGGTYARHTKNTVAYGMEFPVHRGSGNIHSPDEALNIYDLLDGVAIYTKALVELANLDDETKK